TVRSILTNRMAALYKNDRTVRSIFDRRRNWSNAMYLDREEGIGMAGRPGSGSAATDAVEAKAPLDPEILRRWRHPETESPAEEAEDAPRHPLPAVIEARDESPPDLDDKPAPPRIGRRKLALLGVAVAALVVGGGW